MEARGNTDRRSLCLEKGAKTNRTIWQLVSLRRAGFEQLYQVKRMLGGIGNMLFSAHSQT